MAQQRLNIGSGIGLRTDPISPDQLPVAGCQVCWGCFGSNTLCEKDQVCQSCRGITRLGAEAQLCRALFESIRLVAEDEGCQLIKIIGVVPGAPHMSELLCENQVYRSCVLHVEIQDAPSQGKATHTSKCAFACGHAMLPQRLQAGEALVYSMDKPVLCSVSVPVEICIAARP